MTQKQISNAIGGLKRGSRAKPKIVKPIATVNVIEDASDEVNITSYPDNPAGNRAAQELFKKIAKEMGATPKEIEQGIKDNCFITDFGCYFLSIIYSSP